MEGMQHATTATSAKKRQRSVNWLDEDKIILQELVKERVGVLENKNTDTNTNAKKVAAWASLHNSFNCMCVGAPRTLAQLKAQWGIIKMNSKKRKAYERRELIKTGGGPPPPTKIEINSADISSWLPNEFIVDTNPFDSDQVNQENKTVNPDNITNVDLDASSDILTVIIQENEGQDKQEIIAGPESPSPPSPPPPPPPPSSSKPENRKKKMHSNKSSTSSAAEKIAEIEIACRKELHQAQLKNEEKRAKILELEEILLKKKIDYYSKKNDYL